MFRTNWVIFFATSITVLIAGCGDSTGGYGIYRSRDMVTVFVPLPDTSEIAEVKIDTDKRIRNLHFLLKDLEPHETVEIEKIKNLGDRIVIAELVVEPQEKQPPKPQLPEQISDR